MDLISSSQFNLIEKDSDPKNADFCKISVELGATRGNKRQQEAPRGNKRR